MEIKKRDRRDRIQNLLIVLLCLSAALLFVATQSATLGFVWNPTHITTSSNNGASTLPGESGTLADLAAPVHVAVGSRRARFGQTYTTTSNSALSHLSTLMGSALGSAGERTACSDAAFRTALESNSICFDFTVSLPLPVLAELLGTDFADTDFAARLLVLTADGTGGVRLYLRDGNGKCYFSTPVLNASDLDAALSRYEPNGASFAFELMEAYAILDPYTLLAGARPVCPELQGSDALSDKDRLLQQLGFNPHTPNRYSDGDGTETIVEITRTLRLKADGTVLYSSDGDASLSISAAEQTPTLVEAVIGARQLAERLLNGRSGEAQLYLEQVSRTAEGIVVRFGLRREGMTIRYADGSAAAEFTLTGTVITSFSAHLRQYTASPQNSALLPLRQVIAVAPQGTKLTAAYVDDGGGMVSASWLAD